MLYLLMILMPVLSIVLLSISLIRAHLADWPKSQSPPSPESARHPELLPRILAFEKKMLEHFLLAACRNAHRQLCMTSKTGVETGVG